MSRSLKNVSGAQLQTQARGLIKTGEYRRALDLLKQASRKSPRPPGLDRDMGLAFMSISKYEDAARHLDRAARREPDDPMLFVQLYLAHRSRRDASKAEAALRDGLAHHADEPVLVAQLANFCAMQGEPERAAALLKPHVDSGTQDPHLLMAFARVAKPLGRVDEAIDRLIACEREGELDEPTRVEVLFALTGHLDKAGRHEEAWATAERANTMTPKVFNPSEHKAGVDWLLRGWSGAEAVSTPESNNESSLPVFIVGMPRSGTTLVEQIIDAHPRAHGAGELQLVPQLLGEINAAQTSAFGAKAKLTPAIINRHAHALASRFRALDPHADRITDKMPSNFMQVGLLSRLLPNAKFIHTLRDPRDTCLSCYFLNFFGPNRFAYDLRHLGTYYRQYRRVMDHWQSMLPDRVLEVEYEKLVQDPEPHIRRIVEFIGLEWDNACLEPHKSRRVAYTASNEQVRQPIYTSSMQRWRNYESHLQPLLESLGPYASGVHPS